MFADYMKILPIVLPVTIVSCLLVAIDNGIRAHRGEAAAFGNPGGYLVGGLVFGLLSILVYRWMEGTWSGQAGQYFLWLALGLAVLFSILAVAARLFFFKNAPWYLWIAVHFLWALPYGWYLPGLLAK